jgi:hypothetical protein
MDLAAGDLLITSDIVAGDRFRYSARNFNDTTGSG